MSIDLAPRKLKPLRRFDCGSYGKLTAKEIAARAGIASGTVWCRIGKGIRGDELCRPKFRVERQPGHYRDNEPGRPVTGGAIYLACVIAREYRTPPTIDQLQTRFSMSRSTAYRWRVAWLAANGVAA
jgi:hypothetical protein